MIYIHPAVSSAYRLRRLLSSSREWFTFTVPFHATSASSVLRYCKL